LVPQTIAFDCRNNIPNHEVSATLQAKDQGGHSLNYINPVFVSDCNSYTVRRLTPLECERLQGYPDYWTDIGAWTDDNGKDHAESIDSARYKAIGNSIALPPWEYVLQRLTLCCGADVTMASLFDGIGGFPLIWERLNGAGACLWASEIEDFPIAVTKRRFSEEG
jgi:DNA (cytosine-5)-methyltransferase 1